MKQQHNFNYYLSCMFGGALACGLTHLAIVPLDVMKCKKQIDYQFCSSLSDGIKKVKASGHLTLGWAPTVIGYSMQGSGKFGFYQVFKDVYKKIVGEQNAQKYRKIGWTIASASAQFFADFFLSPFQAIKLKIQLSRPGHEYTDKMIPAFQKLNIQEGSSAFYRGIIPLWSRQIPYTMVKFVAYEWFVQYIYRELLTNEKNTYSKMTQLSVTFVSGYMAGILCAIVSHPADTILSLMYSQGRQQGSFAQRIAKIYNKIGFKGLWNGLLARIIMIGTIAGCQWWIYDTFKTSIGLQTTGGDSKKRQN